MARHTGADCKLCRREGIKLFLKGDRCYSDKCAMERRPYPPGKQPKRRPRDSEYRTQLREKQRAKRIYGVLEKQFRGYYKNASSQSGITGENLLRLLESRLDNVVYRLGFAKSRDEARQVVRHGHITVNGRRVNIPSYRVRMGDTIAVAEKSKEGPGLVNAGIYLFDRRVFDAAKGVSLSPRGEYELTDTLQKHDLSAKVSGGGLVGQAGALRHAIARALADADSSLREVLKNSGCLTRDPRMKERKKSGQPGARKRFQFSKR